MNAITCGFLAAVVAASCLAGQPSPDAGADSPLPPPDNSPGMAGFPDVSPDAGIGLNALRPIRLVDVDAEYAYLRRLKNESGEPARALRWGSFYADGFDGPVDRWSVELSPDKYVDVFLYPYGPTNTLVAPEGFSLDMDGIMGEFAAFRLERPSPREVNEPVAEDVSESAAVPDEKEIASVGPVLFPPPAGFVNLSSRPDLSNQVAKAASVYWTTDAVFGKIGRGRNLESSASVFVMGFGRHVSLEQYQGMLSERRASLYRRGMSAGVFAPHKSTARSLQWVEVKSSRGGMIAVSPHGRIWVRGRAFGIDGPVLEVPYYGFRMRHVEMARKGFAAWVDSILLANGIDPMTADSPDVLAAEDTHAESQGALEENEIQ